MSASDTTINAPGSPSAHKAASTGPEQPKQAHSCVVCQRRKVKCDRNDPCTNCVKGQVECIFRDPLPPRRHKKKPEANIIARLRRYEELLKKNGIDPDVLDVAGRGSRQQDGADIINSPQPIAAAETSLNANLPSAETGRLITREGKSVYLDKCVYFLFASTDVVAHMNSNLWTSVSHELQDVRETFHDSSDHEFDQSPPGQTDNSSLDGTFLLFADSSREDLSALHPSPVHIFKLWQIFLVNVNPLTKVLHAPTVQQMILYASGNVGDIGRELECLMFSIYCVALTSLSNEDAKCSFGQAKCLLVAKYRRATQRALVNAGLLKSSDLMVLQAFVLLLLSLRSAYDPRSLWSLSGIAVRIAQRIGLHRDGTYLGLPVFETEMRRRLWWQLLIIDTRNAQLSGSVSALSLPHMDTKPPLNVNDSDLYPDMKETPVEHSGLTEMVFCLMRYEVGQFLSRNATAPSAFDGHWFALSSSSKSVADKDRALDELERILEHKYLRHCDQSIPLHLITLLVAKSASCMMRMMAHHPRQYSNQGRGMPRPEKDRFFSICLEIAEYGNILQTKKVTERYLWHVESHFPWHALIYTLSELRHRTTGGEVEKAWQLVDVVYYRQYGKIITKTKSPLHLAIGSLALKAWAAHEAESARRHQQCLPQPQFIAALYGRLKRTLHSHPTNATLTPRDTIFFKDAASDACVDYNPTMYSVPSQDTDITTFDVDIPLIPGVPSFEDSPMDWGQWDDLLQQFQQQASNEEYLQLDR